MPGAAPALGCLAEQRRSAWPGDVAAIRPPLRPPPAPLMVSHVEACDRFNGELLMPDLLRINGCRIRNRAPENGRLPRATDAPEKVNAAGLRIDLVSVRFLMFYLRCSS
jgi:hypothetical protein